MGFLDIFCKKGPSKDAIAKQVRRAKEPYAQPDYRRMAMEQLIKWNNDESIKGLMDRFSIVVQSPHWDEEEKRFVVEQLVELGEKTLPIIKNFVLEKNEVNHALLAYSQIVNDEKAYGDLLIEALKKRPPSDHRSVQGKQEILAAMMEQKNPRFYEYILPHLDDHSDDVQCLAIQALGLSDDDQIKEKLVEILGSESHSARVLRTAATVVAEHQFKLPENMVLSEVVSEDFRVKNGFLIRS